MTAVTPSERRRARLQARDTARIERQAVDQAKRASFKIISKAIKQFKRGESIQIRDELLKQNEIITQFMLTSHLIGETKNKRRNLSLATPFDSVLKTLEKRSALDLTTLQIKYETESLKVLNNLSDKVEKQLDETVGLLISEGASTREGIKVLNETFDVLGITPRNSFQIESIFRTQSQLAYSAGRWQADQDPDIQEILWGYKYVTVGDSRVRPAHVELDGMTAPKDDPIWRIFWTPNGWACRCQILSILEPQRKRGPPKDAKPDEGFAFNPGLVFQ